MTPTIGRMMMAILLCASAAAAQTAAEPRTRATVTEEAQAEKAAHLQPYTPSKAEAYFEYAENLLAAGLRLHPYFQSAYSGGGFTLGAGYRTPVGAYNSLDVRGSFTFSAYKRIEAEFLAPRVFRRRGRFSAIGGWREATQVGFYGLGDSPKDAQVNYGFREFYSQAVLDAEPIRRVIVQGGVGASQWNQGPGSGNAPSVDEVYSPETLSGLGQTITYLHSHALIGVDTRSTPGYARRGGVYRVTFRDFSDTAAVYGFKQIDYEAIQHVPVLRDAWVLSFRGAVSTTGTKTNQEIPFFMLPSVGGGSSLRGYSSWRFRDRNSLLLQAEWRTVVNRFVDMAVFYDTGKVTPHARELTLSDLHDDYGLGFRFHGPITTPLRIDFAKSHEGFSIVFASSAAF
jgi:hypothetical protein